MSEPVAADQPIGLLRVSATSASIELFAEDRLDVALDDARNASIKRSGPTVTVSGRSSKLRIRVPAGIDVVASTTSGGVETHGSLGAVNVIASSGRVSIELARSVDVRANSGRVEIGQVEGDCRVRAASGRVEVGGCCDVDVATGSGRIDLKNVRGECHAHCVSGRIEIEMLEAADVEAETVSGRVEVSLPPGTHVRDGGTCDDDPSSVAVRARSGSGRVDVNVR